MFPDDAACLDWLFNRRWPDGVYCPNCKAVTKHYREKNRPSYSCHCGHHVHPMQGTIFQDSATSLRLWFLAIYLMATTRCGISAKQVERELGVTYKCAWRICKQIRAMLDEEIMNLLGEIEVDETLIGGREKSKHTSKRRGWGTGSVGKAPVFGAVERGGRIFVSVVPDTKSGTLLPKIRDHIMPKSTVFSDEAMHYDALETMGFKHRRVHHAQKVYVMGDAHVNTLEGFWSLAKRWIDGVHHVVSKQHLQEYFNSYAFRWNHRGDARPMFFAVLDRVPALAKADG
ncbi:MAG: IS1595 family transposase [Candidatus Binataceae bacterium]